MSARRVSFVVRGLVQGVAYRASTERAARAERLTGWVRNRTDGAVEGEAQGAPEAVARFLAWCRRGPSFARVDALDVEDRAVISEERGFLIRR